MESPRDIPAGRILVIMPNWLGDAVMATPFLRALRERYPNAYIGALATELVMPVLMGLPLVNEARGYDRRSVGSVLPWIRENRFELAVLLPNSFRSAWLAFRAGIPRRFGYAREFRTRLLTDHIKAERRTPEEHYAHNCRIVARENIRAGKEPFPMAPWPGSPSGGVTPKITFHRDYRPIPTIDYYLRLAEYLGAPASNRTMTLAITPGERAEADQALAAQGILPEDPLVVLVPGANFGSSKCWLPERFAQLADQLMDRQGEFQATVLLASSPAERPIVDAIVKASHLASRGRLLALAALNEDQGISLGALKRVVERSRLMICNDTGPRHFAAAFKVPVVTLFGPTDPVWAETFFDRERQVSAQVPCSPCQLKKCPIDHRCMTGITVDMVLHNVRELWSASLPDARSPETGNRP